MGDGETIGVVHRGQGRRLNGRRANGSLDLALCIGSGHRLGHRDVAASGLDTHDLAGNAMAIAIPQGRRRCGLIHTIGHD